MADLSPPSPASPNEEEHGRGRRSPAIDSPSRSASLAKEKRLVELMSKAAQEIRVERRKVKQLMEENASLHEELKTQRAKKNALERVQNNSALAKEVQDLRRQISDLMTIHKATASELEQTKEQLRTVQSRCREQQKLLQIQAPPTNRVASPAAYAARARSSSATNDAPLRSRESPARRTHSATGFDAMESVKLSRHHSTSPSRTRVVMVQSASPTKRQHVDPTPSLVRIEATTAAAERQYNDTMLSRLRRAIAPPPTREQLAEVVHAMVTELVRSAARNGLRLDMKRVGPCQYDCGKRRLTLTVDSRRLVVKCGGGHVDMNEYAQRHHLWSACD